jgi:4-diphosphocytidyl-2-C-methyl-D-erythritol kinase
MVQEEQMIMTDEGILVRAPAKVNLTLLIAGKRPDGFHEIETIMAKINWYDELLISRAPGDIEVVCEGDYWAPEGKENIIYRACEIMAERYDLGGGMRVRLTKNIPAGSGLGSASSDAAATLIGIDRLLDLDLGRDELTEMAAALGSDVAFFLAGPLSLCKGKGERITEFGRIFDFSAILVLPDVSVSTKEVYSVYKHDAGLYKSLSEQINAFLAKNSIDLAAGMCANMLQESCFHLHKELAEVKSRIQSLGIGRVCLSGSGSAMYVIVGDRDIREAQRLREKLSGEIGCKSLLVSNNRW